MGACQLTEKNMNGENGSARKDDSADGESIVEIFSPYKYRSVELRARWRCTRRFYVFSPIYKRVIGKAL